MFRLLFISFIIVFFGSLSTPFDSVHADSKWDARNSMTPTEPYKYNTGDTVPSKDPEAFGIQKQK